MLKILKTIFVISLYIAIIYATDSCGVPNGNNSTCADTCGIPYGDNTTCSDCLQVPFGTAVIDDCGDCNGFNQAKDFCGECNGGNKSCSISGNLPTDAPSDNTETTQASDGLVEYEHIYYNAADEEMIGYFIYQESEKMMRPGLVMFDGPLGDGGSASAREYAREFAMQGMVVFLPDYFTGRHSEDSIEDIGDVFAQYVPFLEDTARAKAIAALALDQLLTNMYVDSLNVGAIGFCFGGAMALNLARTGADISVAFSLHGEYPNLDKAELTESWNTDYFVEIVGTLDPLIPKTAVEAWNSELAGYEGKTEVDEIEGAYHGFSIKYSQAFYTFLSLAFSQGEGLVYDDTGMIVGVENVILWTEETQEYSFNKIYDAFREYGLIEYDAAADCKGHWGPCDTTLLVCSQEYNITQPALTFGKNCSAAHQEIRECVPNNECERLVPTYPKYVLAPIALFAIFRALNP